MRFRLFRREPESLEYPRVVRNLAELLTKRFATPTSGGLSHNQRPGVGCQTDGLHLSSTGMHLHPLDVDGFLGFLRLGGLRQYYREDAVAEGRFDLLFVDAGGHSEGSLK